MKKYLLLSIITLFAFAESFGQCTDYNSQHSTQADPGCNVTRTYSNVAFTQRVEITALDAGDRFTFAMSDGVSTSRMDVYGPGTGTIIYDDPTNGATDSYTVELSTAGNYYVYIRNSTCTWSATSHTITIKQEYHDGGSKPSITYDCNSTTLSASGGTGSYQWQSSNDGSSWSNVSGATSSTYTITAATNPQYLYYRVRRGINCYGYSPASDAVIPRGNYGGGNFTISSNVTLAGTYNLGSANFTVNSGVTVTIADGCLLEVNANNITINGTINGNGRGGSGGSGGGSKGSYSNCSWESNNTQTGGAGNNGNAGTGTGAGAAGADGGNAGGRERSCGGFLCSGNSDGHYGGGGGGGAGGGASYGGYGGAGGYGASGAEFADTEGGNQYGGGSGSGGSRGGTYGTATGTDIAIGSGGGGAGGGGAAAFSGGTAGASGGDGGGGVALRATNDLSVSGTITVNGSNGGSGGNGGYTSEGNWDCTVSSCGSCDICGEETYAAHGGAGGGAGGGSGGGILLLTELGDATITGTLSAAGGNGGGEGNPDNAIGNCVANARGGGAGGGGRIKIFINPCANNNVNPTYSVAGGNGGNAGGNTGIGGNNGTYQSNLTTPSFVALNPGDITGGSTICYNTTPTALSESTAPSGALNTYTYLWYSSTTNCGYNFSSYTSSSAPSGWSSMGTTTAGLSSAAIGNLTTTTCFVRRVRSGDCYKWTSVVTVTVLPDFNPGTVANGNHTICPLGDPNNITLSTAPSGAAGTYTYQWYSRSGSITCPTGTSTAGWTAISGETNPSYNPPAGLTSTTTYAVMVNPTGSPDCGGAEWASNCRVVTTLDNTNPTITCPGNQTINANASCQASLPNYTGSATTSDNCSPPGTVTVTQSPTAGTTIGIGVTSVTLTANDGNGNTASCSFNVTVVDNTAPSVTCKNITLNLNALGNASIVPNDVYQTGSDNCGTVNLVSVSPNSFNCSNVGANTVTLTVNDGNGNTNTCTATVTVVDNTNPTAICQNYTLALDGSGNGTLTTANINNGSNDACGIASLSLSKTAFNCSDVGSNTVTLTVEDNNGNTSTCNATVTVTEAVPTTASAGNDEFICRGANLTLSGNTPTVGTGSWSWSGPGTVTYVAGSSSTPNATVSFSTGGTYTGTWTITSNCSSSSDEVEVGVNLPDIITTTAGASGTCTSNGVNDWVHLFDNNGNIIASIDDNGQNLGNVTVAVPDVGNATASGVCSGGLNAYMGRYFRFFSTIVSWYGNDINLRLYFTEAELASLIDESLVDHSTSPSISVTVHDTNGCQDDDDVRNINEIVTTKYTTGATPGSSGGVLITQAANGYDATYQAYYIDIVVSSFSDIYLHGTEHNVPLPVELTSFTAKAVNNQFITLNWTTATEINNEGFDILRSTDGINFDKIGWANGYGNSADVHHYSYQDNEVSVGTYYYQLRQVDFDGQSELSDVRSASINGKAENEVGNFVPNPADHNSVITFTLIKDARIDIKLYDATGKLVISKDEILSAGKQNISFDINELSVGTYNAKIILDGKVYNRRLMVNK